jgi:hypothetical protein
VALQGPHVYATGRPGVAVVNGILYAVGGFTSACGACTTNTVEAYNPSTDTWTSVASMPTARELLGAGVVNGILYAVGGVNSTVTLATNEAYASPFFATFLASVKIAVASSSFNLNGSFALGATRSIDPPHARCDSATWGLLGHNSSRFLPPRRERELSL